VQPPYAGKFVGRGAELAQIGATFASGARLVTLVGPGGVGKTRLALECARLECEGGGAWFCDLADARSEQDVHLAVLRALGVPTAPGRGDPAEQTTRVLAARGPLLVLLDNFEQVAHAARVVARWMREAPAVRLLVTSRVPLRVAGEMRIAIEPLAVPPEGEASRESPAVQLFLDRVRLHDGPQLDDAASVERVAELVRRLEGIPLAIELAAARVGVLGVEGLVERAPRQLDVLARTGRAREHRQGTLRATIDWSWKLLDRNAQRALAQCAVFRGGFHLDAAEGVLELETVRSGVPVLDALQSLRDHSLLRAVSTPGERVRFALFEAIREFAADKLAQSRDERRIRERHAAYFEGLARTIALGADPGAGADVTRHAVERENLNAAFEYARTQTGTQAPERTLALAIGLDALLAPEGAPARRIEILDRALALARGRKLDCAIVALAYRARGLAHYAAGRFERAERELAAAMRIAQSARDRTLRGMLLLDRGVVLHARRDIPRARRSYERALEIHVALGCRTAHGRTLGNLGALHHDVGEFEDARTHYTRALAIFRELGEARLEGIFLTNLGILDLETQRPEDARARLERATRLLSLAGDSRLLAITEGNLGMLLHELGDAGAARDRHERAVRSLRAVGDTRSEGLALARLGAALAELGLADDARQRLDESESLLSRVDDPPAQHVIALARALVGVLPAGVGANNTPPRILDARDAMREARAKGRRGEPSAAELSDDVRAMLRILEQAIARADPAEAAGVSLPDDVLAVGPDAAWFRPPHGRWQDLRHHGALRAMLGALVAQHRAGGQALSLDALREVAWPGLKLRPDAANHRAYVALSSLRTRGLSRWLLREPDGYRLERGLAVLAVDTPPPEGRARRARRPA
jgi:predicted ATPase/Tfp pilus assembly protein PilF